MPAPNRKCAAAAGYNTYPESNPQAITCPGSELIRSPNPHSDKIKHCSAICMKHTMTNPNMMSTCKMSAQRA